jgi:hypothetical protein
MLVRDNQQATISWFCGFLEAEGCADRCRNRRRISVASTDVSLASSYANCLTEFDIHFSVYKPKVKKHYKPQTHLTVHGDECISLMQIIDVSLQCRKQEFIEKLEIGASTTTCDAPLTPDLNWLTGVFEGEGFFSFTKTDDTYIPAIRFGNTNERIVQKFALTLRAAGISWHSGIEMLKSGKTFHTFRTGGLKRCKRFLDQLNGYWRSSIYSSRAEKLLRFCNTRLEMPRGTPNTVEQRQIYLDLTR